MLKSLHIEKVVEMKLSYQEIPAKTTPKHVILNNFI